jgi:hypothetical protein
MPTVLHAGFNPKAFKAMFGKNSILGEVHFVHVASPRHLPKRLSLTPTAVVILECGNSAGPYVKIVRCLPEATVVVFTSWKEAAEKLAAENVFDVVLENEPGWRLMTALRNAIERSVFREFLLCDNSA